MNTGHNKFCFFQDKVMTVIYEIYPKIKNSFLTSKRKTCVKGSMFSYMAFQFII